VQGIAANEAAELLQGVDPATVVLLDVREDAELSLAAIDGAVHIPMGQIPARIDELDSEQTIVVMCHSGGRSAQVATYLSQQGFASVFNLDGGIQAWSRSVDPTIPEY
jgi:rhodanese-related sulfurtransferase